MMGEAFLGFGAFNTKKITGQDVIDFIKYRQNIAESKILDEKFFEEVLGKPQKQIRCVTMQMPLSGCGEDTLWVSDPKGISFLGSANNRSSIY